MLRPDAVHAGPPFRIGRRRCQRQLHAIGPSKLALPFDFTLPLRNHRRRTDKAGDELIVRFVIKFERRADLFHDAVMHHHDLVGHGHGFDLIVGDIDVVVFSR